MVCFGFCDYEVKEMRSPACSRQESAIFPPQIHGTRSAPYSAPLYARCDSLFLSQFSSLNMSPAYCRFQSSDGGRGQRREKCS